LPFFPPSLLGLSLVVEHLSIYLSSLGEAFRDAKKKEKREKRALVCLFVKSGWFFCFPSFYMFVFVCVKLLLGNGDFRCFLVEWEVTG
jgi:hypothetical protein